MSLDEPYDEMRDYYYDRIAELVEADSATEYIIQEVERLPYGREKTREEIIKHINEAAGMLADRQQ